MTDARFFGCAGGSNLAQLQGRRMFAIGGCELTHFCDRLEAAAVVVHHTFQHQRSHDPSVELRSPDTALWEFAPDYVVLSRVQMLRTMVARHESLHAKWNRKDQIAALRAEKREFRWALSTLRGRLQCPIWIMTHPGMYIPPFGLHDYRSLPESLSAHELLLQAKLMIYEEVRRFPDVYVLDVDHALEPEGKFPASGDAMIMPYEPLGGHLTHRGAEVLATHFLRHALVVSAKQRRIKCVVVDADNTLWKGVLREDGAEALEVDRRRLRRLKHLALRGIAIAVCSKNDPEDAEAAFLVLAGHSKFDKRVATHRFNWKPKSQNIRSIAEELNISTDSMAFFDDSPFERAEVASALPEVMVYDAEDILAAPDWPHFHPLGELTDVTVERAVMYNEASKRREAEAASNGGDFEAFLRSCELRLEIRRARPDELTRIAELIHRSNQLNATLKRTDLAAIRSLHARPDATITIARLGDKFGDYGLIGAAIATKSSDRLEIQELTFSCRAMGRGVEAAMIEELIGFARDGAMQGLQIDVLRGPRNQEILRILNDSGFRQNKEGDAESMVMFLDLGGTEPRGRRFPGHFKLVSAISDEE